MFRPYRAIIRPYYKNRFNHFQKYILGDRFRPYRAITRPYYKNRFSHF